MTMQRNREIKAYCPDFEPIRSILSQQGATQLDPMEQVDYYYNLASDRDSETNRRLKVRIDGVGPPQVIYYVEGQEEGARTSSFRVWGLNGLETKDMLDAVLGIRAVVRKQREIWEKDNVVFHLDEVEGIGRVLEVEIRSQDSDGPGAQLAETQLAEYQRLLGPHLGERITGSNEDLVVLPQ